MSMPDDSAIVRCPTCQAEVNAAEAAALAGSNGQVGGQQQPQPQDPYSNAINTSFQASEYTAPAGTAPFLGIWKTNVLFTVLGVLAGMAINGFTGSAVDTEGNYTGGAMVGVLAIAYLIFTIVYAAKIYPSYFSDKPMISSSEAVSFLNTFCGGIIFGLLWNHNLTLKNKGISNVVFIVLIAVEFVLVFLAAFALVGAVASGTIS
jgi:hypothetical protein